MKGFLKNFAAWTICLFIAVGGDMGNNLMFGWEREDTATICILSVGLFLCYRLRRERDRGQD